MFLVSKKKEETGITESEITADTDTENDSDSDGVEKTSDSEPNVEYYDLHRSKKHKRSSSSLVSTRTCATVSTLDSFVDSILPSEEVSFY